MSTKTTTAKVAVATALAASAFGLVGPPAFAAPSPPPPPPPPDETTTPLQPEASELLQPTNTADQAGQAGVCSFERYGYTGKFRCNTHILIVRWDKWDARFGHDREESFGIAPSGTIWHAWRNSGGWKEMPGHGRADDTYGDGAKYPSRTVAVKKGSGIWCNTDPGKGWGSWYRCR
jgi:hypothetical protein